MSLNNLSVDYGEVGRRAEGLAAIEEATAVYRRLAQANPDAYEPDLATSLWAAAWTLVQGPENLPLALETVIEAVEIFARLAAQEPAAFSGRLAAARSTQIEALEGMGRNAEATALRLQMESTTAEDT